MYKKSLKFTDFDGNDREEDFHFNLTEAEVLKMELCIPGGLIKKVERIVKAKDTPALVVLLDDLIQRSYGVKTPDGRGFDKSPEVVKAFMQTQAYSDIFSEMIADPKAASEFFNNIIPKTSVLVKNSELTVIPENQNQ